MVIDRESCERLIGLGAHRVIDAGPSRVRHNPDDRPPPSIVVRFSEFESLTKRILIRPVRFRCGFVDDGDGLGVSGRDPKASAEQGNLKDPEEVRRDAVECQGLLNPLRPSIENPEELDRLTTATSCGSTTDTRYCAHAFEQAIEELLASRSFRVFSPRKLHSRGQHMARLESEVDTLRMDEARERQTAADATIVAIAICDTISARLELLRRPTASRNLTPLATTSTTSAPAAFQLGRTPKSTPVRAAILSATASIAPSSETSRSHDSAGATVTTNRRSTDPRVTPRTPPKTNRMTASVSSCRTTRRLEAPSAVRMATSRRRAAPRAVSIPATFTQAIKQDAHHGCGEHDERRSEWARDLVAQTDEGDDASSIVGRSAPSRAAIAVISCCACASDTPGLSRPTVSSQKAPLLRSSALGCNGTHASRSRAGN